MIAQTAAAPGQTYDRMIDEGRIFGVGTGAAGKFSEIDRLLKASPQVPLAIPDLPEPIPQTPL